MSGPSLAPILRFALAERGWPPVAGLDALAERLPAVACAGMEYPLAGEGPVDLQQRIRSLSEVHRLTGYLQRRAGSDGLPPDSPWQRVLQVCRTELAVGHIEDLWLELDAPGGAETPPLSVFVRLPASLPRSSLQPTIERLLTRLGGESSSVRREALNRSLEACPPEARVSHLGVMLGRPGAPIRLVVDGVDGDDIPAFLTHAAFPGSIASARHWADTLSTYVDRFRLALTLADSPLPVLGFECFVGQPDENDPRWRSALDLLVRAGLCSRERRDRILAWPAVLTPAAASGDWPHPLVMEALARSPREIGWLNCLISHVKITLAEDRPPVAKAYIGFLEAWADVSDGVPATVTDSLPRLGADEPEQAMGAALDFLLAARTQTGWWLDYDGFQEGVSDEWVTAYVAHAMAESGDDRAVAAGRRAWALLVRRERTGWGWNAVQPADADSTLWALRLAARLGELDSEPARAALAFLRLHVQPGGGVATYRPDSRDERPPGRAVNPEWHAAHSCVTAAAAFVPLGPGPLEFLRQTQQSDGSWSGYWWQSPAYATAHAAEALAERGTAADGARVARAVSWAESFLATTPPASVPGDSAFEAALALRLLLLAPTLPGELIAATVRRLLAGQHADGSWTASAQLAIPNARGQQVPALDRRRAFTTATVLRALCRLRPSSPSPTLTSAAG